ncbi:MAG: beta-hexosaminidase [Lachnospiraceae bacterium]|nr:beta-hexosaminidase [Lachnospiraceae bacterium]
MKKIRTFVLPITIVMTVISMILLIEIMRDNYIIGHDAYDKRLQSVEDAKNNKIVKKKKAKEEVKEEALDEKNILSIIAHKEEFSSEEYVEKLLNAMTIEEKIGQMFFVRCPDNGINEVLDSNVGGVLLFARDFENEQPDTIKKKIQDAQDNSLVPMLIGVDEEGGTVTRISRFTQYRNEKFKSPRELYEYGGIGYLIQENCEKCELLKSLGINVNFAPVCDVSEDSSDFIYDRSIGLTPYETGIYVYNVVLNYRYHKVGSVLKHFPGYGSNSDTHTGISVDKRTLEYLEENDLVPFAFGMEAGCECIMVSHNIINCMDDSLPSSLSLKVHEYLRNNMNYDNVIITDDLAMDAIVKYVDSEKVMELAIKAGNDCVISTNYKEEAKKVSELVENGTIKEETINNAVRRILKWKISLELL